jgi:EAL domain-containing protein (putative c-di-GMP-specific phosphodiesterase class I)
LSGLRPPKDASRSPENGASRVADWQSRSGPQEDARLSALAATGILDTEPESSFDAITRLCAEYFRADTVLLGFADASRLWIKSYWGEAVRELPRKVRSSKWCLPRMGRWLSRHLEDPHFEGGPKRIRRLGRGFLRQRSGAFILWQILGTLTVFGCQARRAMALDELRMLESLADMAASQLELRMLRKSCQGARFPAARARKKHSRKNGRARSDLRRALERASLCSTTSRRSSSHPSRLSAFEALIRWAHPERGLFPPWTLFRWPRRCGLILPIGDWGLSEVCKTRFRSGASTTPSTRSLRVCVNLSARQFARAGLADHVEALLRQSGVSSRQLGLEMTESSLIPDMGTALEVLGSLRRLGVSLLMDDFGTGYSSLSYLHRFPSTCSRSTARLWAA